jgi:hypothetical protein
MLMLLMVRLLSGAGQDAIPTMSSLTAVSSVPPNDAVDGARFLMCSSWGLGPAVEFLYRIRPGTIRYLLTMPLA